MRQIVLIIDNIRSVYNTASLFRTAECFGVQEIVLIGTTPAPVDRFGRERIDFSKVSLGSEKMIPWKQYQAIDDAIKEYKERGFTIAAIEQSPQGKSIHTLEMSQKPIAIVVGNEVDGVHADVLGQVDDIYEISQFGNKESLNVSIAGSIALYHLRFIAGDL